MVKSTIGFKGYTIYSSTKSHTQEAVKKLIHQFETHPNREALKADLRQHYAYNPFSEKSQDMIRSMENVEHLEMYEISPTFQCPHCLTHWTTGIVFCTCGTCLRPTDKTRKLNRDRFDALSIPNYVIKKGPSAGSDVRAAEALFPSQCAAPYAAGVRASKSQERPSETEQVSNAVTKPLPGGAGVLSGSARATADPAGQAFEVCTIGRFFTMSSS